MTSIAKSYPCTQCDKSFVSKSSRAWHLKTHNPEAALHCEYCNKIFYSTTTFKNHVLVHKNEKPHVCSECHASFRQKISLTQHMRKHTEVILFPCDHCKHTGFTYKKALRKHLATEHPDEYLATRKFLCELCWEHFHSSQELAAHNLATHDKHKCQLCGRQFRMRGHLTEHILRHANVKPFGCKRCPQLKFLRRKGLLDHIQKVHPEVDTSTLEEVTNVDFTSFQPLHGDGEVPG